MLRLLPWLTLLCSLALSAQTLSIPIGNQGDPQVLLPARGISQRAVLEQFGLPDEEHPPVGRPPMTRWDYRDFSVYFEGDRVIDSVRHHSPHYPQQDTP